MRHAVRPLFRWLSCAPILLSLACGSQDASLLPPCDRKSSGGRFDIDVPTVALSGKLTLNGQPISSTSLASVLLRNQQGGDVVILGALNAKTYTQTVLPGTYDIYYSSLGAFLPDPALPRNSNALIKSGVAITKTQTLDVDVTAITVNGTITVNGIAAGSTLGGLALVNATTGDRVDLGTTGDASYSRLIVPGTYDLAYTASGTSTKVPNNSRGRLKQGLSLSSAQVLNIDVPMVTISGNLTVNSAAVDSTAGQFVLRQADGADRVYLGRLGDKTYTRTLLPGTYDLYYELSGQPSTQVPANASARVKAGVSISATQALNLDVPAVLVNGNLTLNGAASDEMQALVLLRNTATSDSITLGALGDKTYTRLLVPGSYDVYYRYQGNTPGPLVPSNSLAKVRGGVSFNATGRVDVDVPSMVMSGKLTVNGAAVDGQGSVILRDPETTGSVVLGQLGERSYSRSIVPGSFDVYYRLTSSAQAGGGPVNFNARVKGGLSLQGTQSLDIDLPVVPLTGQLTLSGQPAAAPPMGQSILYLNNPKTLDSVRLGVLADRQYSVAVLASTYNVTYQYAPPATPGAPLNPAGALGCVEVTR